MCDFLSCQKCSVNRAEHAGDWLDVWLGNWVSVWVVDWAGKGQTVDVHINRHMGGYAVLHLNCFPY